MIDSEFLCRVAPPAQRTELSDVLLWTMTKDGGKPLEAVLCTAICRAVRVVLEWAELHKQN
jgi:hypothetical protein